MNETTIYHDVEYSVDDILPVDARPMYRIKGYFYALCAYLNHDETMLEWWQRRGEADDVLEWWID